MKNYIIFIFSFLLLFFLFQLLSGIFLTAIYKPDIKNAWEMSANLSQEVIFVEKSTIPTLIFALLSATIAYFTPKLLYRITKFK